MTVYVLGDAALARTLGVSRQGVRRARIEGRVEPDEFGWFDVTESLTRWRESTYGLRQRGVPAWLRAADELTPRHVAAVVARARREPTAVEA